MNKIEMLDIVDENDNLLGTYSRDEVYQEGLEYVRVIEAFIINSKGELWIPTRRLDKRIAPGGFDIGVGGHIEHGESELDAFRKEVSEEIGQDIDTLDWRLVGKFGPRDGLNTISFIYEIKTDNDPPMSDEDFVSSQWIMPIDLAQKIKKGHPAKSNIPHLLRIVYGVS